MVVSSAVLSRAEVVHSLLCDARKNRRILDSQIAALLLEIEEDGLFRELGYTNVYQYAKAEHGMERRPTQDLVAVARKLRTLPAIAAAFSSGELDKTKVREIVRVARPENEAAWAERAKSASNRELEALVKNPTPDGFPPDVTPEPELKPARARISYEMEASEAELFRQAMALLRLQMGEGQDLEDGVLLTAMARLVIAQADGPMTQNAEPYRIVITHCASCLATRAGDAAVSHTIGAEAMCDSVITEMRPGETMGETTHSIPARARTIALCKAEYQCTAPHCGHRLFLHLHHIDGRGGDNPHRPSNLAVLCPGHHRLIHAGYMGIERNRAGNLVFRTRRGPLPAKPCGAGCTHVGGCSG